MDPFTAGNSNPLGATAKTIGVVNSGGSALSVAVDPTRSAVLHRRDAGQLLGQLRRAARLQLQLAKRHADPGVRLSHRQRRTCSQRHLAHRFGRIRLRRQRPGQTGAGNIAWFPISASGTTYTIAAGSTIAGGIQPIGLAEDSDDNFVLAVSTGGSTSSGDPDLEAYTMSSGTLTAAITSTTGTDPVGAIAIAPLP